MVAADAPELIAVPVVAEAALALSRGDELVIPEYSAITTADDTVVL